MRMIGDRIILREFRQEDITPMRSWVTDNAVTDMLSGIFLRPQTWEDTESYLSGILNGNAGGYNFVIADKESLRYLGQCNLLMVDQLSRNAEMAIVLPSENHGKGYGPEAIRLLLDFAFNHANLHKVYLEVWSDNAKAIKAYEKVGFRKEGVRREAGFRNGGYCDKIEMGILDREFNSDRK